jgi:hypothetical protein
VLGQWLGGVLQAEWAGLEVKVAAAKVLAGLAVGCSDDGLRTLEAIRRRCPGGGGGRDSLGGCVPAGGHDALGEMVRQRASELRRAGRDL